MTRLLLYTSVTIGVCLSVITGCAPVIVAGAGTAATAAHDRRTIGAFVDDETVEVKARKAIFSDSQLKDDTHINVTSLNGIVLLSGEATTPELRDRILDKIRTLAGVRQVVNEIQIAPPTSFMSRSYDTWLTSKAKAKMINTQGLDSSRIKVVTENKSVFLMGLVTRKEAELATNTARLINGVTRVVKLFEYID